MRDHEIILKTNSGDEVGRIRVGVLNDGNLGVIHSSFSWNYEDEEDDKHHTVLLVG